MSQAEEEGVVCALALWRITRIGHPLLRAGWETHSARTLLLDPCIAGFVAG